MKETKEPIENICCTLNNQDLQERKKMLEKFRFLIRKRTELEDGYVFTFGGENDVLDSVLNILKLERQCCPFLSFDLSFQHEAEPILLKITGPKGTKEFIIDEMGLVS